MFLKHSDRECFELVGEWDVDRDGATGRLCEECYI